MICMHHTSTPVHPTSRYFVCVHHATLYAYQLILRFLEPVADEEGEARHVEDKGEPAVVLSRHCIVYCSIIHTCIDVEQ